MELSIDPFAIALHQLEGVAVVTVHVPPARWDAPVAHEDLSLAFVPTFCCPLTMT